MPPETGFTLTTAERRRGLRLAHWQGALWSMGNGLTTGALVSYLVLDLGANGTVLGVMLALPAVTGLLRLIAPALIRVMRGGVKQFALTTLSASYVVLCVVPLVAALDWSPLANDRLYIVIGFLASHQLFEYLGTVALWAWLGELAPSRMRGRYFARRQRWQLAVLIPTLLATSLFVDYWRRNAAYYSIEPRMGYVLAIALGVALLLLSLAPLAGMPAVYGEARVPLPRFAALLKPFADAAFLRLLLVGFWFSFFNGLTQSAQNAFPRNVLGFGVFPLAIMLCVMRLGQMGLSTWVGPFSDRYGNRPVLIVCQALVATGLLFFLLATPEHPWWIAGAWIVWSAFVGHNICLPNLMLKLAPAGLSAAYIAGYFAITSVAYAASTYAGGALLDYFQDADFYITGVKLSNYGYLFYVGWITRTLGVILVLALIEPGAWTWREIIRGRRTETGDAIETLAPRHALD